ncbi:MAG: hypothetical protein ABI193_25430 [Minicystis sp.]
MSDLSPPPTIAQRDDQRFRLRRSFERAFLAHLLAYPLAFAAACAAIPLAIHLFIKTIDTLGEDLGAIGQYIVRLVAWPAGALFAVAHLLAIPWVFSRDPARGRRFFLQSFAILSALVVLAGAASWLWLWLR